MDQVTSKLDERRSAQVVECSLCVGRQQPHFSVLVDCVGDHPCATALAHACSGPAQFAQAAGAGNQIALMRVFCDGGNQRVDLCLGSNPCGITFKALGGGDGEHASSIRLRRIYSGSACLGDCVRPQCAAH